MRPCCASEAIRTLGGEVGCQLRFVASGVVRRTDPSRTPLAKGVSSFFLSSALSFSGSFPLAAVIPEKTTGGEYPARIRKVGGCRNNDLPPLPAEPDPSAVAFSLDSAVPLAASLPFSVAAFLTLAGREARELATEEVAFESFWWRS